MGKINSRAKGKRGELEVAALLKEHGVEARRGQQHSGGGDSPDVVHSLVGFHVEVKRTESLSIYEAMAQAERDKKPTDRALIFHKRNNKPWLIIMDAHAFLNLLDLEDTE